MQTIIDAGFDRANGFRLELKLAGDRVSGALQATEARLAAGEVDFIDTDWLSIARCRRDGLKITGAVPYGAIFGCLVAPLEGGVRKLADLPGKRIGAVRRLDKNWLLLRAACKAMHEFDPQQTCELVEAGSKTALAQLLRDGELDAALLFWHQVPALIESGECREVCDLLELLPELGVHEVPSTFFVFRDELVAAQPELVRGFAAALRAAERLLREDAAAWQQAAGNYTGGPALRAKWQSRIKTGWQAGMAGKLKKLAQCLGALQTDKEFNGLPEGTLSAALEAA